MEAWGVWLVAIGVVVSGAAAAFTWVQAHAAVESLRDARLARDDARESAAESARLAGEANDAFKRQAVAQEEANRIEREKMTPPDWTVTHGGETGRVTNTSRRLLIVEAYDVFPEAFKGLVSVQTNHKDGRYEYGDSFEVLSVATLGGAAEKMKVRYRYEDDAEDEHRTLHISL